MRKLQVQKEAELLDQQEEVVDHAGAGGFEKAAETHPAGVKGVHACRCRPLYRGHLAS